MRELASSCASETKHGHERRRLVEAGTANADAAAGDDRDILLPADAIGHRRRRDRRTRIEAPHFLECGGVIGRELSVHVTGEQKLTLGAQHARLGWRLERLLAEDFAGLHIDRPER